MEQPHNMSRVLSASKQNPGVGRSSQGPPYIATDKLAQSGSLLLVKIQIITLMLHGEMHQLCS